MGDRKKLKFSFSFFGNCNNNKISAKPRTNRKRSHSSERSQLDLAVVLFMQKTCA